LQSLNEELNAVNTELEHKVVELDETSDDLRNLLPGNDIASIFLDTHTRIKWFTPAVTRLFDVIDTDIGRPIAHLAQKFINGDLVGKARQAIDQLLMTEESVRANNGRQYLLRVQPYRTRDNRIVGAVASFVDVTELERSQSRTAEARDYAEAIVRTVHDPMIVLCSDLSANPAFYEYFQTDEKDTWEISSTSWATANGTSLRFASCLWNCCQRRTGSPTSKLNTTFHRSVAAGWSSMRSGSSA
jgi:two-component system CheB/CheR fusion protein